jgi:hypothetical protein
LIRSYKKQSNKKINLVVDLSCNVGGEVWIEHFIASWLCRSVKEKVYNPISGALGEYTIQADVNTDGVFNENDYLPNDVNVFCIISNATFSCGNLLSCNLKDQLKNVKFIGDWTGGGSCYVGNIILGLANLGNISSTYHAQNINNEDAENVARTRERIEKLQAAKTTEKTKARRRIIRRTQKVPKAPKQPKAAKVRPARRQVSEISRPTKKVAARPKTTARKPLPKKRKII